MREQVSVPTECAYAGDGNALGRHAGGPRLLRQHTSHIDGSCTRGDLHPQCIEHLRAHFIACPADGRAQMHEKSPRISPPSCSEECDPTLKDSRSDPPPPAVQKGHRSRVHIEKIDRHAVGNRDREENTRVGGGVAVRRSLRLSYTRAGLFVNDNPGLVDLAGVHDGLKRRSLKQIFPPRRGPRRRRFPEKPEIERIRTRSGVADPRKQPRESVGPLDNHV